MQELVNFKISAFIDAANELARADEVERALKILDNLPAYYRDNEPRSITVLRNEIMARIATAGDYKNNDTTDKIEDVSPMRETLRYQLLKGDVSYFNGKKQTPHIIDYAPGEFWVPILLKEDGLKFTYQPIYICDKAFEKTKHLFEDTMRKEKTFNEPTIFVAFEIIEHLHNENEIKIEMLKAYGRCDIIHVSTPKYSYDYECKDWRERSLLGHLRAYTPREFFDKVQQIFPEYEDFGFYDSVILHARGFSRGNSIDRFTINI